MLNFVKLKQNYKRHSSPYWPNAGVGDIKTVDIFKLLASAWAPKSRFDQSDKSSVNPAVDMFLTVHQRFFVSSSAIYLR